MVYSKRYGLDEAFVKNRNDLVTTQNYVTISTYSLTSDLFDNNQLRLFMNPSNKGDEGEIVDYITGKYADYSRKIVADAMRAFFISPKQKIASGGSFVRTAGGLDAHIPAEFFNVNIRGIDASESKKNLRKQLTIAYKSGLSGIMGKNKLLAFASTGMIATIDWLYEGKVVYNDVLKGVEIKISTYRV
jgi:hypothetical protein